MVMIMEKRKTKKISSLQLLLLVAGIEIVWTESDPSEKIFQAICTILNFF